MPKPLRAFSLFVDDNAAERLNFAHLEASMQHAMPFEERLNYLELILNRQASWMQRCLFS